MDSIIPQRLLEQKRKLHTERSSKAVAYIRVSDDSQIEGESLATQRKKIQEYADNNGIVIVKWFGDEGKSGKTVSRRAEMLALLSYCAVHKGEIGYSIFYKMQRSSRHAQTYYSEIEGVLQGLGVVVRSATEYIDETPTGNFMKGMLVMNAQLDNEIKSGVTTDNMQSVARQGWWQQGHLVGYSHTHVKVAPKKKRLTLKRNQYAGNVAELFEDFAQGGLTQADIMRMAKEKDIRNFKGKHMDDNAIYRMLTQPAYAGYICNKNTDYEMYEGQHFKEAIIRLETFEQVQRVISSQNRKRQGTTIKVVDEQYPLRRTLLCFNCKLPYYASSPKTGGGKSHSPRYHCARKSCKGIVPSIKASVANDMFAELLRDFSPTESTMELYKEILNRTAMKQLDSLNKRLGTLRNAVTAIDAERSTAMRRWNKGEITDSDKNELIISLEVDKLDRNEQIDNLEKQQAVKQTQIDYAMNFMHDAHKLWIDADVTIRQRFQKMIFPEGVILDTKTMNFGTTNISPLYRYITSKKELSEAENSLVVTHPLKI